MKSCNFLFYKLVHLFIATSTMQYLFTQIRTVVQKLSLRFNGHFPGEPASAGVYWSKGWWRWWWQLDYWSHKSCKAPIKWSPPTNQHSVFSQAWCPSCRPTNSVKALKEKYHIPWTCLPQAHMGVFQLCLWPLIAPGYLGGGLLCLSSASWCQYTIPFFYVQYWLTLPSLAEIQKQIVSK